MNARANETRDEWLALRCQHGEPEAFRDLVREMERPLLYFARKILNDEDKALDVLQEVWLKAFRTIRRLEYRAKVSAEGQGCQEPIEQFYVTVVDLALNGVGKHQNVRNVDLDDSLQRALENGANPTSVYFHLALVHFAQGDHATAPADSQRALKHDPSHHEARTLHSRLVHERK